WIVSRLVMSIGMFIASLVPSHKKIKGHQGPYIVIDIILTLLIIGLIVYNPDLFPPMHVDGESLTSLKITIEYFISAILIITAAIYHRQYVNSNGDKAYILLVIGFFIAGLGEMSFTLYHNVYDTYNLIG